LNFSDNDLVEQMLMDKVEEGAMDEEEGL